MILNLTGFLQVGLSMKPKTSFLIYTQHYKLIVANLSTLQKANLLDNIFIYHLGEEVIFIDQAVEVCFSFMKQYFDQNAEKYENKVKANQKNGQKGGRPLKILQDYLHLPEASLMKKIIEIYKEKGVSLNEGDISDLYRSIKIFAVSKEPHEIISIFETKYNRITGMPRPIYFLHQAESDQKFNK